MDDENDIKELEEEIHLKEEPIEEDEILILNDRTYENEKFEEFTKNIDVKIEEPDILYIKEPQVNCIGKCNDQIKLETKETEQSPFIELPGNEIDVEDEKLILNNTIYENQCEEFTKNHIKIEETDVLCKEDSQVDYIDKCNWDVKSKKQRILEINMTNESVEDDEKLILNDPAYKNDKLKEFNKNVDFKVEGTDIILYKAKSQVNCIDKYNERVKLEKKETAQTLLIENDVKKESIVQDEKLILNDTVNQNDKLKKFCKNVSIKFEETNVVLCKGESQMNCINKCSNKIKSRKKKDNQQRQFGLISLKTVSENSKYEVSTINTSKASDYINQTDLNGVEIGSDDEIDMDSNSVDKLNLKQVHTCFKFKNIKSGSNKFKLIDTGEICDLCKYEQKLNINKEIIKEYQASTDKKFICQKCDYYTYHRSNMKKHLVVHDNVRPFKCNSCNKRFKRNSDLKSHSCRHIRNKSFQGKIDECKCSKYPSDARPSIQDDKESLKHCRCDIVSGLDNGLKKHIQDKWAVITKQITSVI